MTVTRRRGLGLALLAWLGMAVPSYPATGTLIGNVKLQLLDNNANACASCRLFVYEAGTSTKTTTWSDVSLTVANTNPIVLDAAGRTAAVYLAPGTSQKFVLAGPGSDDPPASPIWTQDFVANIPPNNVNIDVTGTAGHILAAGQVVYLSDGGGGRVTGRWYRTNATNTYSSITPTAIGMAVLDIDSGSSGTIRLLGRFAGLSGLAAGSLYYIDTTDGILTATPPANARPVATADSTSSVVLSQFVPIPDASVSWAGRVSTGTQSFGGEKTFEGGGPWFYASGVANNAVRVSGRINGQTSFTDVGNVGAGEDNLHSATLLAGTLSFTGMVLRVTAWGTYAATADSKRVRCYFGATVVADSTAAATNGGSWRVVFDVIRKTPTAQTASGSYEHTAAAGTSVTKTTTSAPAETLANAITIKCTGEGVADNNIIQSAMVPETVG